MVGGEIDALRMGAQVGQSHGRGIVYEKSEYPMPCGPGSDLLLLLGVESHGDEHGQGRSIVAENAECSVACARHGARLLDDVMEQERATAERLQEVTGFRRGYIEPSTESPGADHSVVCVEFLMV
jgi:hypothetical protein